jgi:hypothetical protein
MYEYIYVYIYIYIHIDIHTCIYIGEVSVIQELKIINENLKWRLQQRNRALMASQGIYMYMYICIHTILYVYLYICKRILIYMTYLCLNN